MWTSIKCFNEYYEYLQILNILIIRNMELSATPVYCDDSKK